jgi:3-oxoacyl-[acyl-carrier-protein] synthase II
MGFEQTWQRAARGESGLRLLTRCSVDFPAVVGEIPDWDPAKCTFATPKEVANWNAAFVLLTMEVCKQALEDAKLAMDGDVGPRTACLVGSAINGTDAYREAMLALGQFGPNRVSPFLLPNVCANVPAGKAGALLGFTGPIFSPQGACASGNHAIALGARMLRDGDSDFALVGGVDMPLVAEIVHGFANMNATFKMRSTDRAQGAPAMASRPFSSDRRGFVLSEGAAVLVLASEDAVRAHGLHPRAEIAGVGLTSDACHFTRPNKPTIVRAIREAIDDAGIDPGAIGNLNAHGTSTLAGDSVEVQCLRDVFGVHLPRLPISANKSQIGHSLGASGAIEAALAVEGLRRQLMLPTINYLPDPSFGDLDVVREPRHAAHEFVLSNAFGFGGTNCCIVLRGV